MHGNRHNRELSTIQRIIARLYALADQCERAAAASALVRFLVLWTLRYGEIVVRDYAEDVAAYCGYRLTLPVSLAWQDSSPEGAICLAHQFRVLADILEMLFDCFDLDGFSDQSTAGQSTSTSPVSLILLPQMFRPGIATDAIRRATRSRAPPSANLCLYVSASQHNADRGHLCWPPHFRPLCPSFAPARRTAGLCSHRKAREILKGHDYREGIGAVGL